MKTRIYAVKINKEMVEKRVFERLKVLADKRERPVAFLVRKALLDYLEREEAGRLRFPWKR